MTDYEKLYKVACSSLGDLILDTKIDIRDISRDIRTSELGCTLYGLAFRVSRGASDERYEERYIDNLRLLCEDIDTMACDFYYRAWFVQRLAESIWDSYIGEEGVKQLEKFRAELPEELLRELSQYR